MIMEPETDLSAILNKKSYVLLGVFAIAIVLSLLAHISTSDNRVAYIHNYDMTGNLGGGEAYDVHLADGEEIHLTSYKDRHPLCQDGQNSSSVDCSEYGEEQASLGFTEAEKVYSNGTGFRYGSIENDRFGTFATCYNTDNNSFYTCIPSPINIVSTSTKALLK